MKLRDEKIWSRPWFRKLSPKLKCLFDYIVDNCDDVGIWIPDFELASIFIGEDVFEEDLSLLEGLTAVRIGSKFFFPDHILFQWKIESFEDLNPRDKFHVSIVRKMRKISELREYVKEFDDPRDKPQTPTIKEKETKAKDKPKALNVEERKIKVEEAFRKDVSEIRIVFPELEESEIESFVKYWTESSKKSRLVRFEKETTFDIKRRLQTWSRNKETNFGRGPTKKSNSSHGQRVSEKLRSGMELAESIRKGNVKVIGGRTVKLSDSRGEK